MKTSLKILVSFSLVIFTFTGIGAYYIVSSKAVSIIPMKMNVVYVGVDNLFMIKAAGVDSKNLLVKGSYGSSVVADSTQPGGYHIRVTEPGSTFTISVSEKTGNVITPLASQSFRAKKIPDPTVYAGNLKGDAEITSDELGALKGLSCQLDNFDFNCNFTITEYKMSVNESGAWLDYSANSSMLTDEMKEELSKAVPGTRIFFHDVTAKGSDGQVRKLMGVNLTLK